jgi:YbbR domain-containing protein
MRRALTANFGWKLLSLGLAFVLWALMGRQSEMAMTVSAPVQYRNIADDLDISSDIPERVSLEVRGPADRLTPSYLANASVALDFAHLHSPGEYTFNLDTHNTRLPLGIAFERAVPSQIRVRFERSVTREVPVRARFFGTPPEGYRLALCRLDPQTITIRGPESHVVPLESVQTDPIDLTGLVAEHTGRIHAYLGDPQIQVVGHGTVEYKLTMQKGGRDH